MSNLWQDVRAGWKDGLIVLVTWIAAMLIACTFKSPPEVEPPEPEHATDYMMGGPGWRVVDVRETDRRAIIDSIGRDVADCLNVEPVDLSAWRFFGANGISRRVFDMTGTRWQWRPANGITLRDHNWVYVVAANSRRSQARVMGTLVHEIIHIHTPMLDHPVVDPYIGECAGHLPGQERYIQEEGETDG